MLKMKLFLTIFLLTSLPGNAWAAQPVNIYDAAGNPISSTAGALNVSATITATINTNGSFAISTVVGNGAVITFSPPANAVGFVIEASSSNTVNLRYAVVTAPTTSSGMRLEPGRDSGFIPADANVKVIAESGSNQEAEVQWILSN